MPLTPEHAKNLREALKEAQDVGYEEADLDSLASMMTTKWGYDEATGKYTGVSLQKESSGGIKAIPDLAYRATQGPLGTIGRSIKEAVTVPLTGMAAVPVSGLAGLGALIAGKDPGQAMQTAHEILQDQPTTKAGEISGKIIGYPIELLHKGAQKSGDITEEVVGRGGPKFLRGLSAGLIPEEKTAPFFEKVAPIAGAIEATLVELAGILALGKLGKTAEARFVKLSGSIKDMGAKVETAKANPTPENIALAEEAIMRNGELLEKIKAEESDPAIAAQIEEALKDVEVTRETHRSIIKSLGAKFRAAARNAAEAEALRKAQAEEIQRQTDPLTGLSRNRATLHKFEGSGKEFSILDIDKFKDFNDAYGHGAGDAVLVEIAKIIKEEAGTENAVRWGGEEKAMVGEHGLAERVINRINQGGKGLIVNYKGKPLPPLTVSGGKAILKPGMKFGDVVNVADKYLYKAKAAGRKQLIGEEAVGPSGPTVIEKPRLFVASTMVKALGGKLPPESMAIQMPDGEIFIGRHHGEVFGAVEEFGTEAHKTIVAQHLWTDIPKVLGTRGIYTAKGAKWGTVNEEGVFKPDIKFNPAEAPPQPPAPPKPAGEPIGGAEALRNVQQGAGAGKVEGGEVAKAEPPSVENGFEAKTPIPEEEMPLTPIEPILEETGPSVGASVSVSKLLAQVARGKKIAEAPEEGGGSIILDKGRDLKGISGIIAKWVEPFQYLAYKSGLPNLIEISDGGRGLTRTFEGAAQPILERLKTEFQQQGKWIEFLFPLRKNLRKYSQMAREQGIAPEDIPGITPKIAKVLRRYMAIQEWIYNWAKAEAEARGIDTSGWTPDQATYVHHMFIGSYQVVEILSLSKGKTLGIYKTQWEAIEAAVNHLNANRKANIIVQPKEIGDVYTAAMLGRRAWNKLVEGIVKNGSLTREQILESGLMKGVAWIKRARPRQPQFMHRHANLQGYEMDPLVVTKALVVRILRGKLMEPWSKKAYAKAETLPRNYREQAEWYIRMKTGNFNPYDPTLLIQRTLAGWTHLTTVRKIGHRPVTTMLNVFQPIQTAWGVLGSYLFKGYEALKDPAMQQLLKDENVIADASKLTTVGEIPRAGRGIKLGDFFSPLGLFNMVEKYLNRQSVFAGAYLKAIEEFKWTREEAIRYGHNQSDRLNFMYGAGEQPRLFSTLGGRAIFQFKTYPTNFMWVAKEMLWDNFKKGGPPDANAQAIRFITGNIAVGGLKMLPVATRMGVLAAVMQNPWVAQGVFRALGVDISTNASSFDMMPQDEIDLLGVPGGDLKRLWMAAHHVGQGEKERALRDVLATWPAAINVYEAIVGKHPIAWASKRYNIEMSPGERVAKLFGYKSTRIGEIESAAYNKPWKMPWEGSKPLPGAEKMRRFIRGKVISPEGKQMPHEDALKREGIDLLELMRESGEDENVIEIANDKLKARGYKVLGGEVKLDQPWYRRELKRRAEARQRKLGAILQ